MQLYRILLEIFFGKWPLGKPTKRCNNITTGLRVLQNSVNRNGGTNKWRRTVRNGVLSAGSGPVVNPDTSYCIHYIVNISCNIFKVSNPLQDCSVM